MQSQHWIILAAFLYLAYKVWRGMQVKFVDLKSDFHWPSTGAYEFEVVGESHYQKEICSVLPKLLERQSCTAVIVPENDNPYDKQAVGIYLDGLKVGHMSRDDARSFRRLLKAKGLANATTSCDATISGGGVDQRGRQILYGVFLDLKTFS